MRPADQHGLQLAEAVEPHKGWRACWGKLHCFASSSRKRGRRRPQLLPAPLASNPGSHGNLQISDSVPSSSSLSPLAHAPPSSPASFAYSDHLPSSAALLTLFPLKSVDLCSVTTRGDSSFRGLDPVLVTPPLHSTLTTEPTTPLSTAPFTPPPELAHLTTPPSPEVPFAEFVTSSLSLKYGERVPEQADVEAAVDPSKLELTYQLYSGSPIARSGTSSVEVPSPLPERVSFLEDDGRVASLTSLLQTASPFGFNQAISANAYGHCSPELVHQHTAHLLKSQHAQTENVTLEMQADVEFRNKHLQSEHATSPSVGAECSCEAVSKERGLKSLDTNEQSRSGNPGLQSESCAHDSFIERVKNGPANDSLKKLSESNSMVQLEHQKQEAILNLTGTSVSAIRCMVEKHMDGTPDVAKCTTCGVLTSKCRDLSEALHETKEKLILIEEKENMLGDREKKFKRLIEWLQLEAKSQQASICRLSEELSWQELAFLDLQEKHLAELGVDLSAVSRDFTSTEVS